jgi:hypothetical protein
MLAAVRRPTTFIIPIGAAFPQLFAKTPITPSDPKVERTFSWFGCNRRLAKDFENLAETLGAFVALAPFQLASSGGLPGVIFIAGSPSQR